MAVFIVTGPFFYADHEGPDQVLVLTGPAAWKSFLRSFRAPKKGGTNVVFGGYLVEVWQTGPLLAAGQQRPLR